MASLQTDNLFKLIKSLSKAEKRSFKLYSNRINHGEDTKFIKLFNILDKQLDYDETALLRKATEIKPAQLSNIKAHLYKSILSVLRLNNLNNDIDIALHQQIDYAKILYNRALYSQSLKILDKVKQQAKATSQQITLYEIIEIEKLIESQYITDSLQERADLLTKESEQVARNANSITYFSNFSLKLYSFYLRMGYVRNKRDAMFVEDFFNTYKKELPTAPDSFLDKLYYYQAHVWYHLILQDFVNVYRYSVSWIDLFKDNPSLKYNHADLYFKGYGNLLNSLYFIGKYKRFNRAIDKLKKFTEDEKLAKTVNNKLLGFKYLYESIINKHFFEGSFRQGIKLIPEIDLQMQELKYYTDINWQAMLHYKIACLYFGADEHRKSLSHLNTVIQMQEESINKDVQAFSRILALICHYELGDVDFLDYQIKSVYRFLLKQDDLYLVQKIIIKFLKTLPYLSPNDANEKMKEHLKVFKKLQHDRFEKRPFLYLD
ncbi:MAG: hypothetical protein JXA53_01160, partial [Bacteroidales bacterium]|nr:hypothetical protein [Bacteroidales bacterium]